MNAHLRLSHAQATAPMLDVTQQELVARVRAGDARAFESLFHAHYGALCTCALRIVDSPAEAEELVQDLFADLWAKRADWTVTTSVRAYLLVAVRHRALNALRRAGRERAWAEEEGRDDVRALHPFPTMPDQAVEAAEMREQLGRAIEALPARCQLAMQLRWREQMSHAGIAEYMGITVKGVERLLTRGLDQLRRLVR